ncbi:hypothetical protein Patl1_02003 [Pistacia atlantica]|uniref:Uncharacterized protein n=1 Tax=Pistacia atlantica TaxID=434234 RepID=A0ACC1CAT0_9ROSI|nr:hypothetical protein Patl1_02003 [Pistacia atlantica]
MFVSCSRTEDVALIEYAWLSCCLISMFSLETGRVKPETFRFSYYTFPNALELFLVKNCLFSFWKDWLSSWTTCQRKVLSPGTTADILVGQIDHSFEGMDGGIGSQCHDIWNSLQAMNGSCCWDLPEPFLWHSLMPLLKLQKTVINERKAYIGSSEKRGEEKSSSSTFIRDIEGKLRP